MGGLSNIHVLRSPSPLPFSLRRGGTSACAHLIDAALNLVSGSGSPSPWGEGRGERERDRRQKRTHKRKLQLSAESCRGTGVSNPILNKSNDFCSFLKVQINPVQLHLPAEPRRLPFGELPGANFD